MFAPLMRISPSSAILTSTPGSARPTVPKRWFSGRRDRRDRRRLGHAVALEHRDAAAPEELEDLRAIGAAPVTASRSRPPNRSLTNSALGCERRELLAQLRRDRLAADLEVLDLAADRADRRELLGRQLLLGQRVELLEDARHRRQVGRLDLHELGDDLLRVAAEVGDRACRGRTSPSWMSSANAWASGRKR